MDLTLNGKVAMITGGSRGLGRQCALALGQEGCAVSICGRDGETVEKTVSELAGLGVKAHGSQADVTSPEDAERFLQETTAALGAPDILVNNVGGRRGSVLFDETSMEQFLEGLEVNLISAVRMTKLALPHMQAQGWGRVHQHIVDLRARAWRFRRLHDGQGRHDRLLEAPGLAIGSNRRAGELRRAGQHRLPRQHLGPFSSRTTRRKVVAEFIDRNLPMGKFGWPEPIGETVAFLASDRAGLITGACINVDGGQSKSLF